MILKNLLNRIPRPAKVCLCALLVVLLAGISYVSTGCPTLTLQQEFRRAEKVNLVGPSRIVDTVGGEYSDFEKMLVGETDYGICFFGRYGSRISGGKHEGKRNYLFLYQEKTGDLTIAAAPNVLGAHWGFGVLEPEVNLPVYLFANERDAVRAEIEVTVTGTYMENVNNQGVSVDYSETFHGATDRTKNGIFRFFFHGNGDAGCEALYAFSTRSSGSTLMSPNSINAQITATVRLYDIKGELICAEILDLGRSQ